MLFERLRAVPLLVALGGVLGRVIELSLIAERGLFLPLEAEVEAVHVAEATTQEDGVAVIMARPSALDRGDAKSGARGGRFRPIRFAATIIVSLLVSCSSSAAAGLVTAAAAASTADTFFAALAVLVEGTGVTNIGAVFLSLLCCWLFFAWSEGALLPFPEALVC